MRISDWSSDVCSSDLDAADAIGAFEIVQRFLEIGDQRLSKRVQRLRPVQRDDADAGFLLDDDVLVAHDISFSVWHRCRTIACPLRRLWDCSPIAGRV